MQQLRKFAFYLILAGYRYSHSKQIKHSYRCYSYALRVYYNNDMSIEEKKRWDQIYDHMSVTMGRLSDHVGQLQDSVSYLHDFMKACTQAPDNQKQYMNEFLASVKKFISSNPQDDEIVYLDLPHFDATSFKIFGSEYNDKVMPLDRAPRGSWKQMEESLVRSIKGKTFAFKWDNKNRMETWVVGEPLYVDVELKNPLFIPLDLSQVRLFISYKPEEKTPATPSDMPSADALIVDPPVAEVVPIVEKPLQFDTVDVTLRPGEKKVIRLSCVPLEPGLIHIEGIKWTLNGAVKGKKLFHLKGKRLSETKLQRQQFLYEEDKRNKLKIIKSMPKLHVAWEGLQTTIYRDEVQKVTLILTNKGNMPLKNMHIKTDLPNMISFQLEDTTKFPSKYKAECKQTLQHTPVGAYEEDLSVFKIAASSELQPEQSIRLTAFIHGSVAGAVSKLKLLAYYEPVTTTEAPKDVLPYRLTRNKTQFSLIDSVVLNSFGQPSLTSSDEFVIGLEVKHLGAFDKNVIVKQVTSISPKWTITPLNFKMADPEMEKYVLNMFTVPAKESTTMYFTVSMHPDYKPTVRKARVPPANVNTTPNPYIPPYELTMPQLIHTIYNVDKKKPDVMLDTSLYPFMDLLFRQSSTSAESQDYIKQLQQKQVEQFRDLQKRFPAAANSQLMQWLTIKNPIVEGRLFSFLEDEGLSLMVHWKASDKHTIWGQSQVLKVKFLPEQISPSMELHPGQTLIEKHNTKCPLRVKLISEPEVLHNFADNNMCIVPVTLEVINFSPDLKCDCTLEMVTVGDDAAVPMFRYVMCTQQ